MAKQPSGQSSPTRTITSERATRLFRLLTMIGKHPQPRPDLLQELDLDIRGFYRDLQFLRDLGITIDLVDTGYTLRSSFEQALAILPFPDANLNLHEAIQLSDGRSQAHRKLKALVEQVTGKPFRNRPRTKLPGSR